MKQVLIISPYFPPSNAADMQRIRMSLPFYKQNGWEATLVSVKQKHSEIVKDENLLLSIPDYIKQVEVDAFSKKITKYFGLGSIALRSLYFYKKQVNYLLRQNKYDLIFFSTTQFPVCILGAYWKKKFKVPYVIDMQDPWHSDYYQDKPKAERPKKYWFSYHLNKLLEPIAMKQVDGLMSVSQAYLNTLAERYPRLKAIPQQVITFGAFQLDFELLAKYSAQIANEIKLDQQKINIAYVGRGGYDLVKAVHQLCAIIKKGLSQTPDLYKRIHIYFIGTSYAPNGKGIKTILPTIDKQIQAHFTEVTDRIGFYESLKQLKIADGLLILGSNDRTYTASKLYPYILAKKPLLAILHQESSAMKILQDCKAGYFINLDQDLMYSFSIFTSYLQDIISSVSPKTDWEAFEPYTALSMTEKQVDLFNQVADNFSKYKSKLQQ